MSEAGSDEGVLLELTVEGELGPVLRRALHAYAAERQLCTIFQATAEAGDGVAELVRILDEEGLTVESIRVAGLR